MRKEFTRYAKDLSVSPRDIARLVHGISCPLFSSIFYSHPLWGKYREVPFDVIVAEASKITWKEQPGKKCLKRKISETESSTQ